nr:uncharacterized protein LOC127328635 [Lolium perenne]
MGSFNDSIAVGRVLYAGNFPIVPQDESWIPAKTDPVKLSIIPIDGIHIFIGETVDSDGNAMPFFSPLFLLSRAPGAMGKKKSASASGATKVSRDWGASTISNREVNKLRTLGLISPSDDDIRLPEDDDDDSEETEDTQHILEDNDVQEDEAPEDDALTRSRRCKRINEDLITTAEASPSGQDNDADETASPPPAVKSSTGIFAVEDDLDLSDDDDDVPLAKRAKLFSGKSESAKESNPSPAKPTSPSRTVVEKIPVSKVIPSGNTPVPSAARDHPIYATVDAVADFADQFVRLESENAHLRKTIKTSADQVLEANKLAADAQNENILLKDELKKLKQKMKDEQDARREAAVAADEK